MSLKGATIVTSLFGGAVLGVLLFVLVVGSLFFDDPHASYGAFLHLLGSAALGVVVATAAGLLGARLLARSGHRRTAVAVALLPLPVIVESGAYLIR